MINQQKVNKPNLFSENIPEELKEHNQWVVYRMEERNGKRTKVPYQSEGRRASSTDPGTWCSFTQAFNTYKTKEFDGIGFVFTKDDPYCGIDYDTCVIPETKTLEPWAKVWIDKFASYSEYSPSMTGVHTIVKGKLPSQRGKRKGCYEIYDHSRYFTFTGDRIDTKYSHIKERQNLVEELYLSLNGISEKNKAVIPFPERHEFIYKETEELINKAQSAKNSEKFSILFGGQWNKLGYLSQSEADQALCSQIAFYTDNPYVIDQVFRRSGLFRDKWERQDYREGTIKKALELRKQHNISDSVSIHNTDLGNSQRVIKDYGDIIRYCSTWKKWLVWNDQYGAWKIDDSGEIFRIARKAIQNIYQEAAGLNDPKERKKLVAWGLASESVTKMQAMVKLAESGEGISISPNDIDLNPWLLNCLNGTIDLRTGQLNNHNKRDLITKVIPVAFDPNANCPKWINFLNRIMDGNQELISFLQRAMGYALTGDTREECFFILHGCGANGKSTFIKTIGTLLGDYAQAASFETFLSKKQGNVANNDIARMQGKRFISAVEAEESRRLAENVIKQVTGKDVVAARFLYAEYFEFLPQFKIFLATNHKPKINCNDPAIWRRVKLIPFAVTIPLEQQIQDLDEQLEDELSGILNWAVNGCLEWRKEGLQTPDEVVIATKEYREEMDTVNAFIDECCTLSPMLKVNATVMYTAYKRYCELNGEAFLSMKEFGKSLNDKGYEAKKSNGKIWRCGMGLLNQYGDFESFTENKSDET